MIVSGGGGRRLKYQAFTASGTWTRPSADVLTVLVTIVGGGGSGGGGYVAASRGGGGGGAGQALVREPYDVSGVSVGGTVTVTIGVGGASRAAETNGQDGGDTSFGTLVAKGGKGGVAGSASGLGPGGASGGGNPERRLGPDFIYHAAGGPRGDSGGAGGRGGDPGAEAPAGGGSSSLWAGGDPDSVTNGGGGGGASLFGRGGNGGQPGQAPASTAYGAGGAGGRGANPNQGSGAGRDGYCLVEWWE